MRWTLSARSPFSLSAVIRSHGWVRLAPFGTDDQAGRLTYVQCLGAGQVVQMLVQEAVGARRESDEERRRTVKECAFDRRFDRRPSWCRCRSCRRVGRQPEKEQQARRRGGHGAVDPSTARFTHVR